MSRPANLLKTIASQLDDGQVDDPSRNEPVERQARPAVAAQDDRTDGGVVRSRAGQGYASRNRPHTIVLPNELIDRLNEAVRRTGRSKADLARTAMERYLEELSL